MERILVVVDMQNDFINGSLGSEAAEAIVPKVIDKINNWNGYIIATRDTHDKNYLKTKEGKMLPIEHCIMYTKGWGINGEISEAINEHGNYLGTVNKETFGSLDLLDIILDKVSGSDFDESKLEITLIGLCTDICVISNAMLIKAMFPNSEIIVDSSCCAGTSKENHENALKAMKCCHITIK